MNIGSFIAQLPEYAFYMVVFVVIISVLVAAHELGHYLFARLFGMGVEEFAIGFGAKPLFKWSERTYEVPLPASDQTPIGPTLIESGGSNLEGGMQMREAEVVERGGARFLRETTVFTIRPYPLGGFVRIKGMIPQSDGSEIKVPGGIYSKPAWQRLIVLFAGPAFSVISGILLLIPVFMFDGIVDNSSPVLGAMNKLDPGYKAGLRPDDRVVSIENQPITKFFDMVKIVRDSGGKTLTFVVEREGQPQTYRVTPRVRTEPTPVFDADQVPTGDMRIQSVIGVSPSYTKRKVGFGEAVGAAVAYPIKAVQGLGRLFAKPQTFTDQMGGPATMVAATASAVQLGFSQVIALAALLSISVGIMNLLPIFPLDGGQMAVAIAEMLRGGRRLSLSVQEGIGKVGFVLVVMLFLAVFYADFKRFVPLGPQPKAQEVDLAYGKEKSR